MMEYVWDGWSFHNVNGFMYLLFNCYFPFLAFLFLSPVLTEMALLTCVYKYHTKQSLCKEIKCTDKTSKSTINSTWNIATFLATRLPVLLPTLVFNIVLFYFW